MLDVLFDVKSVESLIACRTASQALTAVDVALITISTSHSNNITIKILDEDPDAPRP